MAVEERFVESPRIATTMLIYSCNCKPVSFLSLLLPRSPDAPLRRLARTPEHRNGILMNINAASLNPCILVALTSLLATRASVAFDGVATAPRLETCKLLDDSTVPATDHLFGVACRSNVLLSGTIPTIRSAANGRVTNIIKQGRHG